MLLRQLSSKDTLFWEKSNIEESNMGDNQVLIFKIHDDNFYYTLSPTPMKNTHSRLMRKYL
jgi:hypothetical protein